eukprot:TRINITY_DN1132_c0_g1_i1.p1 TRINITY_DN1132_c0_g1~~TRINITY_DN1132_c0_g1_i1.p1  ORF type:complete len:581 (+),score=107.70 TRINITY_DN1132_c0_g1_i1:142-1884(+)
MKVIIVGGVAGGASTGARLRRLSEDVEITIFEKGGYVSYANCGLPYYIGGEVQCWDNLQVTDIQKLHGRFNLDVHINKEVVAIDRAAKKVAVKDTKSGETTEHQYDHLVLSVGCEPIVPRAIPGIDRPGHFTLKSMEDTASVERHIASVHPSRVVVCGGGFIGLEIAEQLVNKGLNVSIVEAMDQVMAPLDLEMAEYIHGVLRSKGVNLHLADAVAGFEESTVGAKASDVLLKSGTRLPADMVILALGVRPSTGFVGAAGIELTARGHVKVDDCMRTVSDPNVWALGDAIEVKNSAMGGEETWAVALGGPANRQGRICAENIIGKPGASKYKGTIGTNGVKLWDTTAAGVGVSEKFLRGKGVPYKSVYLHARQHAEFYPHSIFIHMKLVFDPASGKIYGAQAVGEDGVEKRIDVIATAMMAGMTARDLQDIELCYAPPFGAARDPVNFCGMVAGNIMDGILDTVTPLELLDQIKAGTFTSSKTTFIDVRTPKAVEEKPFSAVPKAQSVHIQLEQARERVGSDTALQGQLKSGPIVVACNTGVRAHVAARMLMLQGYKDVKVLSGSYLTYKVSEDAIKGKK